MIELIQTHQPEIADICRRQGIHRLDVFGSAATGQFNAQTSDVDFIAEFDDSSPSGGLLDRYLELATRLEAVLGTAVDIITPRSLRNPYFRESVNASRETVYAT
jgi:predicted nucleotidyltransferase